MDQKALEEAEKMVLENDVPIEADAKSMVSSLEDPDSPPAFGEEYGRVAIENDSLDTKLNVTEDGRVNINIAEKNRRLSRLAPIFTDKQLDLGKETLAVLDK